MALLFRDARADDSAAGGDAQREAREMRRQGYGKASSQDLRGAHEMFRASYDLYPDPATAYDMAQVERALGQPLAALKHYRRFLEGAPAEPEDADLAKAVHIARDAIPALLTSELGLIEAISRRPGVEILVDAESMGATPLATPIEVLPGAHLVVFRRNQVEKKHAIEITAGQRARLEDDPDLRAPSAAGPTRNDEGVGISAFAPPPPRPFYKRWYVWGAVGAATLIAVGIGLYAAMPHRPSCPPEFLTCVP